MKRILLFLLFVYTLLPKALVVAKEGDAQAVDPIIYSIIKQEEYLDSAFPASEAANLSPQKLFELVAQSQAASAVPAIGAVKKTQAGYEAISGLTGAAVGEVSLGRYKVTGTPISGVVMVIPSKIFTVEAGNDAVLDVALKAKDGDGVVSYADTWNDRWKELLDTIKSWFMKKKTLPQSTAAQAPMIVRFYNDKNGNTMLDKGEKLVPWANARLVLESK